MTMQYTPGPFAPQHLLALQDYSPAEILQVLSLAALLKDKQKKGIPHPYCQGQTLAMIFAKASTRTRISFEVGIHQLGGTGLFLSQNDLQLGRGETIADTAKVLSRYVNGIMIRTFSQQDVADLAAFGSVPVINGLTDYAHPCQALADLLTVYEHTGSFSGIKLCFIGDGNNVANSLAVGCTKVGMDFSIASPKGYELAEGVRRLAKANAEKSGSKVLFTNIPEEAAAGAHAVYTDVFASMGQESEKEKRLAAFAGYQVTPAIMAQADKEAIFLHCLPAHRGEEVAAAVIDSKASKVFDEAENRLHVQKAVMALLMGGGVPA